jgi:hypothetical protein
MKLLWIFLFGINVIGMTFWFYHFFICYQRNELFELITNKGTALGLSLTWFIFLFTLLNYKLHKMSFEKGGMNE